MSDKETIAILGGTGDLGTGLAIRWSKAGHTIVIGSRTLEKAQAAVAALQEISPETPAEAMENLDAAAAGEIVVTCHKGKVYLHRSSAANAFWFQRGQYILLFWGTYLHHQYGQHAHDCKQHG